MKAITPEIRNKIRRSFEAQSLMSLFEAKLEKIELGAVEIRAPILQSTRQQHGFAHAGLTFALGDSAAGYSALSLMNQGNEVLTTEMKINLLRPGNGQYLIARGRVIKHGKTLVVAAADVFAEEYDTEELIATLLGTLIATNP